MWGLLLGSSISTGGNARALGKPQGIKLKIIKHMIKVHMLGVISVWQGYISNGLLFILEGPNFHII
jgi:hypothetical protein